MSRRDSRQNCYLGPGRCTVASWKPWHWPWSAVLEDGDALKVAKAAGLKFVGIGGLVLAAVRRGAVGRGDRGPPDRNRLTRRLRDALAAEIRA